MASTVRVNPLVSVVLPARNEAKVIDTVLKSLQRQAYPFFEVWVGDDGSTDGTAQRVLEVIGQDSRFHLVSIPPDPAGKLQGKTQALQHLGNLVRGEIILMTDADMDLPPTWIQTFVDAFQMDPALGVVVGTTLVKDSPWQSMEWLWVLQGLSLASRKKWPTTGMGNNMAVRQHVWKDIQGFSNIGFSLVEDYALYQHIVAAGYAFDHVFSPQILGWTFPPDDLFAQRTRWIHGAWQTRSPWLLLTGLALFWLPFVIVLCFFQYWLGGSLLLATWVAGIFWSLRGIRIIEWRPSWLVVLFAPIVLPIRLWIQTLQSWRQSTVVWKERTYES